MLKGLKMDKNKCPFLNRGPGVSKNTLL
jgi:hypothetical protein